LYRNDFPELYPIMNAFSADDIEHQLSAYLADPAWHVDLGRAGRGWYDREVAAAVSKYVAFIDGRPRLPPVAGLKDSARCAG
jgi:hypothetical protein